MKGREINLNIDFGTDPPLVLFLSATYPNAVFLGRQTIVCGRHDYQQLEPECFKACLYHSLPVPSFSSFTDKFVCLDFKVHFPIFCVPSYLSVI